MPEDDLEQWVIATRRAQGLPDHVEDPAVLARVAELLWGRPKPAALDTPADPTAL